MRPSLFLFWCILYMDGFIIDWFLEQRACRMKHMMCYISCSSMSSSASSLGGFCILVHGVCVGVCWSA